MYSGPVYEVHFKYSSILLQVYISYMYGTNMPILFPITLLAFVNLYINERIVLAYYYQQPPVYDDDLIRTTVQYMKLAPILMFLLGYWVMGNR